MSQRFVAQQWLPFPVAHVFAFFADPANLPRLMPASLGMRIEELHIEPPSAQSTSGQLPTIAAGAGSQIAGAGSHVLISFRPVPSSLLRVRWLARITEFAWNSHFCDEQVRGPFASFRHRHGVDAETRGGRAGTRVTDAIEFTLPAGWLGRIGEPMVRRRLAASFAFRQQRLVELLQAESSSRR